MRRDRKPLLYKLYHTAAGRMVLKPLTAPAVSRLTGAFLDTRFSSHLINPFLTRTGIDMSDYEQREFCSFNDFFTRHLAPGARETELSPDALMAPCDGLLTVLPIRDKTVIPVKGVPYSLASLLRSVSLAERFDGGLCLVFRLCVDNYHRYAFFDSGRILHRYAIPGVLHTVRPVALEARKVFVENSREVTLMCTRGFGLTAQIEVGALLVGRICNRPDVVNFRRAEEKGWFEYGGSTVVVLLRKGTAVMDSAYPSDGEERPVRFGQRIGTALRGSEKRK